MTNTLQWRTARELRLNTKLPVPSGDESAVLYNVRVAIDGSFLHVDTRRLGTPEFDSGQFEVDVYTVPATSVEVIQFKVNRDTSGPQFYNWNDL